MGDRSPSHLLARLLTHERLLLVLIVTYFVVCMGLLLYLRHSACGRCPSTPRHFEELYVRLTLTGLLVLMAGALLGAAPAATRSGGPVSVGPVSPPRTRFSADQIQQGPHPACCG